MTALLAMQKVNKSYTSGHIVHRRRTKILDAFSITINAGERVGLHGPSGCGKSTVARLATGLTRPDSGDILLFGKNTRAWSRRDWARHRSDVQLLFQDPSILLNPMRTLSQNLEETQRIHASASSLYSVAERLQIKHLLNRTPEAFSGGEWRRAALARVLLANPKLLIADEPTTGLDIDVKKDILDLLLECTSDSRALLLISHDERTLQYVTDRCVQMEVHE